MQHVKIFMIMVVLFCNKNIYSNNLTIRVLCGGFATPKGMTLLVGGLLLKPFYNVFSDIGGRTYKPKKQKNKQSDPNTTRTTKKRKSHGR